MKCRAISAVLVLWLVATASAAEPRVLFEDGFAGKLGPGWSWMNANPQSWRLQDKALEIQITPQGGHNVLLRAAPDRSQDAYAVEVTVTFLTPPTEQYEQGGITWYQGAKPVFKLVHEHIDGACYIIPGRVPAPSKTVQLRLEVTRDAYAAQFRADAKGAFQTTAQGKLAPGRDEQISLQCYHGPRDGKHWLRFDDFRIVALPANALSPGGNRP